MPNFNELELRFATAEADAIETCDIRFEAAPAPDIAAEIDAHLEIAIGAEILKAHAIGAILESFLGEYEQICANIAEMRFEQRRARRVLRE